MALEIFRDIAQLDEFLHRTIPLVRALDSKVSDYDGAQLTMCAPLVPNANDKGCGFGGSLASVMTLAGWGLVNLKLSEAGFAAEVFVMDSTIHYLAPVWSDFRVKAIATEQDWPWFIETFTQRRKARATIVAEVLDQNDVVCARLTARFVAKEPAT